MKLAVLAFITIAVSNLYGQDTIKSQNFEEVKVRHTLEKEIAFKDTRYFILDFHIGEKGNFILLNRFKKYYLYSLDYAMEIEQKLELDFRPKRLYHDCLGFVHVMSKDSMYQIEIIDDNLVVYERNGIDLYDKFYKNCVGKNDSTVLFEKTLNYGKTKYYFGIDPLNGSRRTLYKVEDSILRRSARNTEVEILNGSFRDIARMQAIDSKELKVISDANQKKQFFQQIVCRPIYNPLYVLNDTTYIFDHLNGKVVQMTDTGAIINQTPIEYQTYKNWNKKIYLDVDRGEFYSVEEKNGAQIICQLGSHDFMIDSRTKITKHAYPKKIIIHNGYAYYTYKEFVDDNLNKLFRQRI